MSTIQNARGDVFTASEMAQVAGVSRADIQALIRSGEIASFDGGLVTPNAAVRAVRRLRHAGTGTAERALFAPAARARRSPFAPLAASGALHAAMLGVAVLLATLDLSSAPREVPRTDPNMRLVFLATPGPGGGGGGGGLRQPDPPPRAELEGTHALRSPVPAPRPLTARRPEPRHTPPPPPAPPRPVEHPVEPAPPVEQTRPMPQVAAPVATAPADTRDRPGTVSESAGTTESNGPGTGGGAGTGQGTGMGEGDGSGIGPGSGGGTGGGPYRPGSGITPPGLLREVKPDYTEDARRRGVSGDVVLEIVVRRDGAVGNIRILQGLGAGLDQRAVDAVRQWQFSPARRLGTPVDVIVEVAVEFKLR